MGRFPLNGEKIRILQFPPKTFVFERTVLAMSRQDWAASAGDVAIVASIVLFENTFELISHVVAPAVVSTWQTSLAAS